MKNLAKSITEMLDSFVEELKRGLGDKLVKVILFGSHAKGMANANSDIDVLIVHSHPNSEEALSLIAGITSKVALEYNAPLEPIIMTINEYRQSSLFLLEVKEAGKVLYAIDPISEAIELARDYLYLAEKWLEHAIKDLELDPRFSIDSAYNAGELVVKALVILKGESLAKTHGGLIAQFSRLYVASGEVEKNVAGKLHEASMLRNRARYDPRVVLTEREARKVMELATRLLKKLREEVGRRSEGSRE